MPRLLIFVFTLYLAGTAQAGVYNLAEVHPFLSLDDTRGFYLRVRSAALPTKGTPSPESFKAQILRQVAALEQQKADGVFSTLDCVNLSGAYLRLGGDRVASARRLLVTADPQNFLVQSNLAAAYFMSGELDMAVRHQQKALDAWPEVFAGWTDTVLRNYREAERYLLTLYRLRAEEQRRDSESRTRRDEKDLDALFPLVRFVGQSGEYEAGGLSFANRDLLPFNAFNIVYQINLWFPSDMRLYWLLGELYNAAGSIDQAHDVFVELVETGMARSFKDLPRHRRVLIEAKPAYMKFRDPATRGMLLSELLMLTRPALAPPVLGDAAYLAGCGATALFAPQAAREPIPELGSRTQTGGGVEKAVFNFWHIAVGFLFGFVVAALLALQVHEWRRRRLQPAPFREEREPVPISPPGRSTSITPGG